MEEIFKDIPGLEGKYQVSNHGNIKSVKTGLLRKKRTNAWGYNVICFSLSRQDRRFWLVHRAVALAFIPNPENKKTVNHINGIKTDNRVENLEWATDKENVQHSFASGHRNFRGENNSRARLTKESVLAIRADERSNTVIAEEYKIKPGHVYNIKRNIAWKHLN